MNKIIFTVILGFIFSCGSKGKINSEESNKNEDSKDNFIKFKNSGEVSSSCDCVDFSILLMKERLELVNKESFQGLMEDINFIENLLSYHELLDNCDKKFKDDWREECKGFDELYAIKDQINRKLHDNNR